MPRYIDEDEQHDGIDRRGFLVSRSAILVA
jgi:hypothetical protein